MIIIPLTYILLITNFISIFFSFSALNFAAIFAFILSLIVPYDEAMDMGAGGVEYELSNANLVLFIAGTILTLIAL